MQHAVMVPIGDNEPVFIGLQRVLETGRDEEGGVRQVGFGPGADIGNNGKAVRAVHAVDADDIVAFEVRGQAGDQGIGRPAEESDIDHPAADEEQVRDAGRQTAGEESGVAALAVDAPDAASQRRGDIQVAAGADDTALQLLQTAGQQGGRGLCGRVFRCGCRTAEEDHNT